MAETKRDKVTADRVAETFKQFCGDHGFHAGYILAKSLLDSVCEDLTIDQDHRLARGDEP